MSAYGFKSQLPIPVQHLTLFISYCFEKGLSPKSISTYVAGINYYHKLHGFYDLNGIFIVKKILEGCHRSRSTRDKRAPLTKHVLLAVCRSLTEVCFDSYEVKLFHSLFTLAYFGMFRVGELVNTNKHQQGNALLNEDVQITRDSSIIIRLNLFKTNQRGKPVYLKVPSDVGYICPVKAIKEFMAVRPNIRGSLFCHSDGSVVTRTQFSAVLAKAINKTRFLRAQYRTHSFRIGRATDLASDGYPSEIIRKLGRWSSDCVNLYLR